MVNGTMSMRCSAARAAGRSQELSVTTRMPGITLFPSPVPRTGRGGFRLSRSRGGLRYLIPVPGGRQSAQEIRLGLLRDGYLHGAVGLLEEELEGSPASLRHLGRGD